MSLRVLLADSNAGDLAFLEDAIAEAGEPRYWPGYVHLQVYAVANWTEAEEILSSGGIDVLLLNPDLPDSRGETTFRRAQAAAPQVPVILLLETGDSADALRMIRSGAQDFLIKTEVDCAPLAHALSTAIERHRLLTAVRAGCATDSLTSLPNRNSFLRLADRDRRLAEVLGLRPPEKVLNTAKNSSKSWFWPWSRLRPPVRLW